MRLTLPLLLCVFAACPLGARADLASRVDEATGEWAYHEVVERTVHESDGVYALDVGPDDHIAETIEATREHPFWSRGGWTPAGELRPGDEIFTSTGGWIRVHGNTWISREQLVYNLDVEGADTFFVGESGAWVHRHHIFPVAGEFAERWANAGLNPGNYVAEIPDYYHHFIHSGGGQGGRWHQAWRDFFTSNPSATREEIGNFGHQMWGNLEPYARYLGDWRPR